MIHEDNRRILEDWPEAKIITAKEDCTLGNHYHKIKTEKFILISGESLMIIHTLYGNVKHKMKRGELYDMPPNTKHSFELKAGSVMIGLCSHAFDPTDDYR
jgi:D-lyxose ketol-isomerase